MTRHESRRVPPYRHHKPSGQAVVTLSGHDHYPGRHDTPESRERYDALIARWLAGTAVARCVRRPHHLGVRRRLLGLGIANGQKPTVYRGPLFERTLRDSAALGHERRNDSASLPPPTIPAAGLGTGAIHRGIVGFGRLGAR